MERMGVGFGLAPPRASPANVAALHSRPLTLREGGAVSPRAPRHPWIPAFAGMTDGCTGGEAFDVGIKSRQVG